MQTPEFDCFDPLITPIIVCDRSGTAVYKNSAAKYMLPRPKNGHSILRYLDESEEQKFHALADDPHQEVYPRLILHLSTLTAGICLTAEAYPLCSLLQEKHGYLKKADKARLDAIYSADADDFVILLFNLWQQMYFSDSFMSSYHSESLLEQLLFSPRQTPIHRLDREIAEIESEIIQIVNTVIRTRMLLSENIKISGLCKILDILSKELFSKHNYTLVTLIEDFSGTDFLLSGCEVFVSTYLQLILFILTLSKDRTAHCVTYIIGGWLETEIKTTLKDPKLFSTAPSSGKLSLLTDVFPQYSLFLNSVYCHMTENNSDLRLPYIYEFDRKTGMLSIHIKLKSLNNLAVEAAKGKEIDDVEFLRQFFDIKE